MKLIEFVSKLVKAKARPYLVGGAVRDKEMNKVQKDNDYCVTGISQEDFERLFPQAELQGKDFPVYRLEIDGEMCEVALARTERKIGIGYKGFAISASPDVTIEEDLSRRDLTINAMAIDLVSNELIDPFQGKKDIENKIIRATTEAFKEDPLRVYRAARFAARYNFTIDDSTLSMMYSLKSELSSLTFERVIEETKKALLSEKPSVFFRFLKKAQVLDIHFPEIDCLSEYDQPSDKHPEGNVFEHTMQVVDAARHFAKELPLVIGEKQKQRLDRELMVVLSALLHDVGKSVTKGIHPKKGTPTYIGHEAAGVPIAEKFLDRYNLQSLKKAIIYGVENHMLLHGALDVMKESKAIDHLEGKFEPRGLTEEEQQEKVKKGYSSNEINKMRVFVRKPGARSTMGIYEFIALCMADTAGRLKDSGELQKVLMVFSMTFMAVDSRDRNLLKFQLDSLETLIKDKEELANYQIDLINAIKHKAFIKEYIKKSEGIETTLDVEELKERYSGEELGYRIHSNKREQRVPIMKESKKQIKEFLSMIN